MKKYRVNKKKLAAFIGNVLLGIFIVGAMVFAMIDDAKVMADSKANSGDGMYCEWSTEKECWVEKEVR